MVDRDVELFREQGFIVLRAAHAETALAPLRVATDRLISLAETNSSDLFTNYFLRHRPDQGVLYDLYQRFPEFSALARSQPVVEAVRRLIGPNFYLYENSLVFKPKGRENAVPWHQDFMNRRGEPQKVVAWMALDPVTEENGCMYGIPGSHKNGYLPWYRIRGQTHHTRLREDLIDESKAVPLEMGAGDVLLFDACLVHSSRRVDSAKPRRAYRAAYQGFARSTVPRGTPIVISLEEPGALEKPHDYEPNKLKWFIHRVGKRLVEW